MASTATKDTLQFLETLGLSDIEIKIYTTLLEKGGQTVQELARIISMNRTTLYSYINSLLEKGLIVRMVKGERTLFAVNDIDDSVTALVDQKIDAAKQVQSELPSVLQSIHALSSGSNTDVDNFEIKYYKGINGIRKVYGDILSASNEVYAFSRVFDEDSPIPDWVNQYGKALEVNPDLNIMEIVYDSPTARNGAKELQKRFDKRYSCKFMPNSVRFVSEDIISYDDKVAIMHASSGKAYCIVLNNSDYANNLKELFKFTWDIMPNLENK